MAKHRVLILGGGISGLSLGFYLSQREDLFEIDVIEKSSRLGGWIDSSLDAPFFFEKGPRVFRGSRSHAFLSLIQALHMQEELIEASPKSKTKYLWKDQKLRKIPIISWPLIKGLWKDFWIRPCQREDEPVWDFACRHFNERVAADFFDPLVIGIYGGGMKNLSLPSCFPRFKQWEEQYGSIIKGLFHAPKFVGPKMFSFKHGIVSVVNKLVEKSSLHYHLGEEVKALIPKDNGFDVVTSETRYHADFVFSALPCQEIGKLLIPELLDIPMRGAVVVQLGYGENVLKKNGFGYLTTSGNEVLGVIFDSVAFPQFNRSKEEVRLTVKLEDSNLSDEEIKKNTLRLLKDQLNILKEPDFCKIVRAKSVFPQMVVGHQKKITHIESLVHQNYPRLKLVGNYLSGVGVNECIARSQQTARDFLNSFNRPLA